MSVPTAPTAPSTSAWPTARLGVPRGHWIPVTGYLWLKVLRCDGFQLSLAGELDVLSARLARRLLDLEVPEHCDLMLDLSEVTFIDSAGLRFLRDLDRDLSSSGHALRVRQVSATVERLQQLGHRLEGVKSA